MEYRMIITQKDVEEYAAEYFSVHKRAHKYPIEHPYHPSINTWFILRRPQMNDLKQKWKDFTVWLAKKNGVDGIGLTEFSMTFTTFMPTKRRIDPDNTVPKFILDGLTEAGVIVDDDGEHLRSLELRTGYDKDNPRTEIVIRERAK